MHAKWVVQTRVFLSILLGAGSFAIAMVLARIESAGIVMQPLGVQAPRL